LKEAGGLAGWCAEPAGPCLRLRALGAWRVSWPGRVPVSWPCGAFPGHGLVSWPRTSFPGHLVCAEQQNAAIAGPGALERADVPEL